MSRQMDCATFEDLPASPVCQFGAANVANGVPTGPKDNIEENRIDMRLKFTGPILALTMLLAAGVSGGVSLADGYPSGEASHGQTSVEPAYNDADGSLIYLLTPVKASPPPSANSRAVAPLFLVEYPPNTSFDVPFNCQGVPGNCPDHAGAVADVATAVQPGVYGTDPSVLPGHDHLVTAPGAPGDFNVAREVIEVLFTPKAVTDHAITHLTTRAAVDAAIANGDAVTIDLGFALHFSVVPAAAYTPGTSTR